MNEVYEWRFRVSKNPVYGFDDSIILKLNVSDIVKTLVFLMEHLRHEAIEVEVKTPDGSFEDAAFIGNEVLVYLNGLSEVLENLRGNNEVRY